MMTFCQNGSYIFQPVHGKFCNRMLNPTSTLPVAQTDTQIIDQLCQSDTDAEFVQLILSKFNPMSPSQPILLTKNDLSLSYNQFVKCHGLLNNPILLNYLSLKSNESVQLHCHYTGDPVPFIQDTSQLHKFISIHGIITKVFAPSLAPKLLCWICSNCKTTIHGNEQQYNCVNQLECGQSTMHIHHTHSQFTQIQYITLQVDDLKQQVRIDDLHLIDLVKPGDKCVIHGYYLISPSKNNTVHSTIIQCTGITRDLNYDVQNNVTYESKDYFEHLTNLIAPSIFGHTDIKQALVLLLLGGTTRPLPDVRLRGDIHVLLMGDPGVAKSQFLKRTQQLAPHAVFTSGKGSSAAGLTAAVLNKNRQFYLEAGAMVLADKGVICIDEFDKMREEDRVAIHEAMEQQTLSIAKAGITTTLNARASVLAAANPMFGRIQDTKSAASQIEFKSSLLSRFDLLFWLRDKHDSEQDMRIAMHVLQVHQSTSESQDAAPLIAHLKLLAPTMSVEASSFLHDTYVQMRSNMYDLECASQTRSMIPFTVRHLEALVRLSEARAKCACSPVVMIEHCKEALQLFKQSTLRTLQTVLKQPTKSSLKAIHQFIDYRLPLGAQMRELVMIKELEGNGHDYDAIVLCIQQMINNSEIQQRQQGQYLLRIGVKNRNDYS
eukprot:NODE_98_length_21025_cov_0.475055.p3 type:complete len:660 gc:universal NODE_98_length_21025_cov_0.475055:8379-10358(+)